MIGTILYIINLTCILLILGYLLHQYVLFYYFIRAKPRVFKELSSLPQVSIQLPIYNEKYVLKELFNHISKINYPKNLLEIQILDDSTDDSKEKVYEHYLDLKNKGFDVTYIFREDRKNFKAGALLEGLKTAKGEFIAIFDADFRVPSDWLLEIIKGFDSEKIGFVQSRWAYYNRENSLLTQVQGLALDHHFVVEQEGRLAAGFPINFNGTAGIWRKTCIIDAGNWQGDTLTEDLDLSIRAYLKGWKFNYINTLSVPSELPDSISAVRSQQFRWNKGGAQNFVKFIIEILKSKIPVFTKVNLGFHLLNSSVFLWVFIYAICSVPLLYLNTNLQLANYLPLKLLSFNFIFVFLGFFLVQRKIQSHQNKLKFFFSFISFFPYVLGIAWHNSLAVLEAYFKKPSAFIRTPKYQDLSDFKKSTYHKKELNWKIHLELLWILYFGFAAVFCIYTAQYGKVGFYLCLTLGLSFVYFQSRND